LQPASQPHHSHFGSPRIIASRRSRLAGRRSLPSDHRELLRAAAASPAGIISYS
jgi:hypothetical protein